MQHRWLSGPIAVIKQSIVGNEASWAARAASQAAPDPLRDVSILVGMQV